MSELNIKNNGIGATPHLTFSVNTTADKEFTEEDIDNNLTACLISGNNQVGKGDAGGKLFGKVVWVSSELQEGTAVPALCAVQARGVARFKYTDSTPVVDQSVELAGEGKVRRTSMANVKGRVIAVNPIEKTCDVWLG